MYYFHLNTHNHNFVSYTEEGRNLYGHIKKCTICGAFGLRNSHHLNFCLCGESRKEMHNFEYNYVNALKQKWNN